MNLVSKLYLLLVFGVIYAPDFGAIDMKASQWLFLSSINLVYLIIITLKIKKNQFQLVYKNPIFLSFLFFFFACIISVVSSFNYYLSIERLTDIFSILTTLGCMIYIAKSSSVSIKFILTIITIGLFLEVLGSLNILRQVYDPNTFNLSKSNDLRGFYGNKNITAAAIAFKIPLATILIYKLKNIIVKSLIYILLISSFFILLILSARAVFLSITLCIGFLLLMILIKIFYNKENIFALIKNIHFYVIPILISIILYSPIAKNSESVSLNSRITSVIENENDESTTQRLRFYTHAIKQIQLTPFLGVGIGNWKAKSIEYEAEYMYSYIVPFFTHNDLLEVFVETGILGIISYLIFIYLIFRLTFTNIKLSLNKSDEFKLVYLFLPFIVYFVDMNLNFPLDRPAMQILLIFYIIILMKYTDNNNAEI